MAICMRSSKRFCALMKVWTWDLFAPLDASSKADQEVIQRAAQLIQDTKARFL